MPTGFGPTISFLCSAYRTEDTVARTIESVRAQTRDDWELVVVDNGMSDAIADVVRPYADADPRIRLLRQPNRGVQGGVNAAGDAATGRAFAVLHSDDQVLPGFVARLGGVLDARPEVTAVSCDARVLLEPDGLLLRRTFRQVAGAARADERHHVTLPELISGITPYYSGAVRRAAWLAAGGYPDDPEVGDLTLWLQVVADGGVLVEVPEPLGVYSECAQSMSRNAAGITALEEARERTVRRFAEASGRPEDLAALRREVTRSRTRRAIVAARADLLDGNLTAARRSAAAATAVRWSARSAAIRLGLTVAPRAVALLYSAKRRAVRRVTEITGVPRAPENAGGTAP